jgi:hypothetical protein
MNAYTSWKRPLRLLILGFKLFAPVALAAGTTSLTTIDFGTYTLQKGATPVFRMSGITIRESILAFSSSAGDLVANDTNFTEDVLVRDLQTDKTRMISVNLLGLDGGDYRSNEAIISADGRLVLFSSSATDSVPTDVAPAQPNLFVRTVQ